MGNGESPDATLRDREGRRLWIQTEAGEFLPVRSPEDVSKRGRGLGEPDWWVVAKDADWLPPQPSGRMRSLLATAGGRGAADDAGRDPDDNPGAGAGEGMKIGAGNKPQPYGWHGWYGSTSGFGGQGRIRGEVTPTGGHGEGRLSGGSAEDRLPDTRCTITPEKRERIVQAAEKRLGDPYTKADCSNFVHQVYNEAGLPYEYATTKDFPNNKDFVEVDSPQAGDVVVYERHMGIYNPENEANGNPVISSTSRRGVRYGNDTWFEGIPRYFRYKNKQL